MFVAGTSTHKVGEVAQTLLGVAPSASTLCCPWRMLRSFFRIGSFLPVSLYEEVQSLHVELLNSISHRQKTRERFSLVRRSNRLGC
jgi:hypothetical protein